MGEKYQGQNMVQMTVEKMNRLDNFLLSVCPALFYWRMKRKIGLGRWPFGLHKQLEKFDCVELKPSKSGSRGFVLIFDRQLAFYFYQNGDHFEYDGWEFGKYDRCDVGIFDSK